MSRRRIRELMERAMASEDISGEPGVGEWQLTTERFQISDEVRVGNDVRVPTDWTDRIQAVAAARGTDGAETIRC